MGDYVILNVNRVSTMVSGCWRWNGNSYNGYVYSGGYIMIYIQRKGQGYLETVDQFYNYKEAKLMVKEYRISDASAEFYLSQRCCKEWE